MDGLVDWIIEHGLTWIVVLLIVAAFTLDLCEAFLKYLRKRIKKP